MIHDRALVSGPVIQVQARRRVWRIGRLLLLLTAGLLLLGAGAILVFQWAYSGRVYPGLHVAGHDLGGLRPAEVRAIVAALPPPSGQVTLHTPDGAHTWAYGRQDLGLTLDADAVATSALAYGRSGGFFAAAAAQWGALTQGVALATPARTDAAAIPRLVTAMAAAVDRPATAGRLTFSPGGAVLQPGQAGAALDQVAATQLLQVALGSSDPAFSLVVPVRSLPPAVADAQLAAARGAATALVTRPIAVHVAGRSEALVLSPSALQGALVWDAAGPVPAAHLDAARVRALLAPLAGRIRVPAQNAVIRQVRGQPALIPDVLGWELDLDTATSAVIAAAAAPDRSVTLPLRAVPAAVARADIQPVYQQWTALLARGFSLRYGAQTWTIKGARLAAGLAMVGNAGGGTAPYRLELDSALLADRLAAIAPEVRILSQDARYRAVNNAVQVAAPSKPGQQLDAPASLAAAQAALAAGQTTVDVVVVPQSASFNEAALPATISTPDLLGTAETSYVGSSPQRAHNVEFGTSLVDGALIAPGQIFDLNATLGPLTLAAGFQMGWGIVSDGSSVTTVPAEAGGICQVATTLFQSVFWAGLPMVERNHHSYWISSYGRAPSGLQGLDATISPPDANFRWRNTTGNWIVVRAHAQNGAVHFELWGTQPHWKVQVAGPVITHYMATDPTPIYERSSAVPAGRTLQVEHAQPGFTSDIHRQVYDATGALIDDWHAAGTYLPAHNRYISGRGTP